MLKNIMADIVSDLLNHHLLLRYDVCTCDKCKTDMMAYALSRIPAKYVTTDTGAIQTVIEQAKVENEYLIIKKIMEAIGVVGKNPRHELKEDNESAFKLLLNNVFIERGVDFSRYNESILKRRVAVRMLANGVKTYADYLRILVSMSEEYGKLFDALTINVSEFFRDPEVFNAFGVVLKKLIHQKRKKDDYSIRIWSAGCSHGEEPYSIAILLSEILHAEISKFDIQIIATDIDEKCLKTAQDGKYNIHSIKNVDDKLLKKYFIPIMEDYKINPKIKNLVQFQYHDLISSKPFNDIDIIFCRNVFIFFGRSIQEHLIMMFYQALKQGGYLVLGMVEILLGEAKYLFEGDNIKAKIYRKKITGLINTKEKE